MKPVTVPNCLALMFMWLATACHGNDENSGVVSKGESLSHGVVLQYHHIDTTTPRITSTSPDEFRNHLAFIKQSGIEVWPLSKLVSAIQGPVPTADHPIQVVAITFDDAYHSIYETAYPILREHGFPFTVFVATEPVEAARAGFMSWEQLKEMAAHGATIANHTHTHAHLIRLHEGESTDDWLQRVEHEITTAQKLIEHHLGDAPKLFAYPYGEYSPEVLEVVERLDFVGFGQQSGALGPALNPTIYPRFPFGGAYNNLDQFKTKVMTLPLPISTTGVDPIIKDDLTPTITLNFTESDLRLSELTCYTPGGAKAVLARQDSTIRAHATTPVPVGRSRYNCTMPSRDGKRFYWYSQLWIRPQPDGSWYPEP